MPNDYVLYGRHVFTGNALLNNQSIHIQNGIINNIEPFDDAHSPQQIFDYISPAFIDAQIYGANELLLSAFPNSKSIWALQTHCKQWGTLHFLPTIATNTKEIMYAGIDAVKQYWREGGKGCLGLHLEGPWINKEKRGAHIESIVHSPTITEVEELLAYGKGVIKMITLAPEVCNETIIEIIKQAGIIISAGHSNASFEEATHAFNNGIPTVTHLYNAMSPLSHRAPGMVGATFLHPTVYASIIPDGYHVHFEAVKIACKQMPNRLFAITDAVTTTHTGPYQHTLNGNKYESNGILSGSALTMHEAFKNLVNRVNINITDALAMCSTIPATMLQVQHQMGFIQKNYAANIIAFNNDLELVGVFEAAAFTEK